MIKLLQTVSNRVYTILHVMQQLCVLNKYTSSSNYDNNWDKHPDRMHHNENNQCNNYGPEVEHHNRDWSGSGKNTHLRSQSIARPVFRVIVARNQNIAGFQGRQLMH